MSLALCSDKFSKLATDDSKVSIVRYCDVAGYSWNSKTVHFIHIKKRLYTDKTGKSMLANGAMHFDDIVLL